MFKKMFSRETDNQRYIEYNLIYQSPIFLHHVSSSIKILLHQNTPRVLKM